MGYDAKISDVLHGTIIPLKPIGMIVAENSKEERMKRAALAFTPLRLRAMAPYKGPKQVALRFFS